MRLDNATCAVCTVFLLVSLCLPALLPHAACAMGDRPRGADKESMAMMLPGPEGAAFWEYITVTSPYTGYELWPGKGKLYKGTEPHGALLTTYVNAPAHSSIMAKTGVLPAGSIIVKENYLPDATLAAITTMYKVEGYSPEAGDWFWVKYDPAGKVLAEGKVGGCIGCHGSKKHNDYIFTGPLK